MFFLPMTSPFAPYQEFFFWFFLTDVALIFLKYGFCSSELFFEIIVFLFFYHAVRFSSSFQRFLLILFLVLGVLFMTVVLRVLYAGGVMGLTALGTAVYNKFNDEAADQIKDKIKKRFKTQEEEEENIKDSITQEELKETVKNRRLHAAKLENMLKEQRMNQKYKNSQEFYEDWKNKTQNNKEKKGNLFILNNKIKELNEQIIEIPPLHSLPINQQVSHQEMIQQEELRKMESELKFCEELKKHAETHEFFKEDENLDLSDEEDNRKQNAYEKESPNIEWEKERKIQEEYMKDEKIDPEAKAKAQDDYFHNRSMYLDNGIINGKRIGPVGSYAAYTADQEQKDQCEMMEEESARQEREAEDAAYCARYAVANPDEGHAAPDTPGTFENPTLTFGAEPILRPTPVGQVFPEKMTAQTKTTQLFTNNATVLVNGTPRTIEGIFCKGLDVSSKDGVFDFADASHPSNAFEEMFGAPFPNFQQKIQFEGPPEGNLELGKEYPFYGAWDPQNPAHITHTSCVFTENEVHYKNHVVPLPAAQDQRISAQNLSVSYTSAWHVSHETGALQIVARPNGDHENLIEDFF